MIALWLAGAAQAESWCAAPLVAHEWGVHVIGSAPAAVPVPSWFHDDAHASSAAAVPVRDLPADSGIRFLPVVQFYAGPSFGDQVPVALEVGFRDGSASSWWPTVDRRVSAADAGSVDANRARQALLKARAALTAYQTHPPLGPDPTMQLGWDRLLLTAAAPLAPAPAEQPWVEALRAVPGASWVSRGRESDRFVYYEATTHDAADLVVDRVHATIQNRSDWDAHDVVLIVDGRAWSAPEVGHGRTVSYTLRPLDRDALVAWLRDRWVDPAGPPTEARWDESHCVMGRDPAIPVDHAGGYRLYGAEVDVLLSVWADRLLGSTGSRLVYREDPAALDARMPLAVYTDMYHDPELARLGLVDVEL